MTTSQQIDDQSSCLKKCHATIIHIQTQRSLPTTHYLPSNTFLGVAFYSVSCVFLALPRTPSHVISSSGHAVLALPHILAIDRRPQTSVMGKLLPLYALCVTLSSRVSVLCLSSHHQLVHSQQTTAFTTISAQTQEKKIHESSSRKKLHLAGTHQK